MRKIYRNAHSFNSTPLGQAARVAELRHPPSLASKRLARRLGLSICAARAIARANGFGPHGEG